MFLRCVFLALSCFLLVGFVEDPSLPSKYAKLFYVKIYATERVAVNLFVQANNGEIHKVKNPLGGSITTAPLKIVDEKVFDTESDLQEYVMERYCPPRHTTKSGDATFSSGGESWQEITAKVGKYQLGRGALQHVQVGTYVWDSSKVATEDEPFLSKGHTAVYTITCD